MTAPPPRRSGGLLVLVSATGYGFLPLFAVEAKQAGLGGVAVMALRFTLAAGTLWTLVALRRYPLPPRRVLVGALAFGGTCWSIQSVSYLFAVTHAGAPVAALLLYTYPLMVVIVAVVARRQRWHRGLAAAFGLVLAGLALVLGSGAGGAGRSLAGVVAGLVAAVTYTIFILASEPLARRVDPFLFTALAMTGAAATTGIVTLAHARVPTGVLERAATPLLALALLSTVVPAVTFLTGLGRIGAPAAAILSCAEVVVTCVVAWLALGQGMSVVQVAGCLAVFVGVLLATRAGFGLTPGQQPRAFVD